MIMLYRLFDARRRLLYVGITNDLDRRLRGHRFGKSWWPEVTSWTTQEFSARELALEAEAQAIRLEHPAYNIHGSLTRRRRMRTVGQFMADPKFREKLYRKARRHNVELGELLSRLPQDRR